MTSRDLAQSGSSIIETYSVHAEQTSVTVTLRGEQGKAQYYTVTLPCIAPATRALLDEIKQQLASKLSITPAEIVDPAAILALKEKVAASCTQMLEALLPGSSKSVTGALLTTLLNNTLGLGEIEFLLADPALEEIVIPSATVPVRVFHKKHGWLATNIALQSERDVQNSASILARRVGKQLTTAQPLLDAHLITGDRANAVLYPISSKGNTITIRKFSREPWTIVELIANNTISSEIAALLWTAVQYELNVLVSGGTASGKTSLLNVILAFTPPNHRLISIEDTRELQLPEYLFWAPLATRTAGPEGEGEVTMLDLLVNSLRMRPDRIVLGEVRKGRDAEVLFEAMHTGHSVYATVHADSAQETIRRLVFPPISVPPNLLEAVNLNVVMFRDRRRGIRRVSQVAEFVSSEENNAVVVKPNILYRWAPADDALTPLNPSLRLFDDLSRHTGVSQEVLFQELANKKSVLDWMVKYQMRDFATVSRVVQEFYLNPEFVINRAKQAMRK